MSDHEDHAEHEDHEHHAGHEHEHHAHHPPSDPAPSGDHPPPLVDFVALGRWLRRSAVVLLALGVVAGAVDAVVFGASPAQALGWVVFAAGGIAVVAAIGTFVHAARGASAAASRGERLGGDDVGLLPRRRLVPFRRGTATGEQGDADTDGHVR